MPYVTKINRRRKSNNWMNKLHAMLYFCHVKPTNLAVAKCLEFFFFKIRKMSRWRKNCWRKVLTLIHSTQRYWNSWSRIKSLFIFNYYTAVSVICDFVVLLQKQNDQLFTRVSKGATRDPPNSILSVFFVGPILITDPWHEIGHQHGVPAYCCCRGQNINNRGHRQW